MGGYYGVAVLVGVSLLLTTGQCDESCRWTDGQAGEPGAQGRDGYPGGKGEKGDPAVTNDHPLDRGILLSLRGQTGNPGPQGVMGPKGFHGLLGRAGDPGASGLPGPEGKSVAHDAQVSPQQDRSAFSVIRTDVSYPRFDQVVTFRTVVVNTLQDFNVATGIFVCRLPGVYYFTFHSMAKVSMCLRIVSNSLDKKLGFCDHNRNSDEVLSGGVVLTLMDGQKVWLESFKDKQSDAETRDTNDKRIIFSGFLLFQNPE